MLISNDDYEYRGLMAEMWDFFRGDTSQWEDRFFYLECVRLYGQPVLDVGCGTGRILLDFLNQGIDIDGVDNSPEMLELLRRKAAQADLQPRIYHQVMEGLSLTRNYQLILVPSSSFQLLLEPEKPAQAMQRFYEHLIPGGRLVMPFMDLWKLDYEKLPPPYESSWSREKVRQSDGAIVRRTSSARYDPESQLEHTEEFYEIILNGNVVAAERHRKSPATRSYNQQQAVELYRQAGFEDIQMYKEFKFPFQPADPEDFVFTIIGKKPEGIST